MVLGGLNEDRAPGSSCLCLRRKKKILFPLKEFLFALIKMTFLFALEGNDVFIRACAYFICAYSFVSVRKD